MTCNDLCCPGPIKNNLCPQRETVEGWQASHSYAVGDRFAVLSDDYSERCVYEVTTAFTSGSDWTTDDALNPPPFTQVSCGEDTWPRLMTVGTGRQYARKYGVRDRFNAGGANSYRVLEFDANDIWISEDFTYNGCTYYLKMTVTGNDSQEVTIELILSDDLYIYCDDCSAIWTNRYPFDPRENNQFFVHRTDCSNPPAGCSWDDFCLEPLIEFQECSDIPLPEYITFPLVPVPGTPLWQTTPGTPRDCASRSAVLDAHYESWSQNYWYLLKLTSAVGPCQYTQQAVDNDFSIDDWDGLTVDGFTIFGGVLDATLLAKTTQTEPTPGFPDQWVFATTRSLMSVEDNSSTGYDIELFILADFTDADQINAGAIGFRAKGVDAFSTVTSCSTPVVRVRYTKTVSYKDAEAFFGQSTWVLDRNDTPVTSFGTYPGGWPDWIAEWPATMEVFAS